MKAAHIAAFLFSMGLGAFFLGRAAGHPQSVFDGRTPTFIEVGRAPNVSPGLQAPPGSIAKFGARYFMKASNASLTAWVEAPFIGSGSSGSPAGATGDVQINSAGAFGADTGKFTYTNASNLPTLGVKTGANGGIAAFRALNNDNKFSKMTVNGSAVAGTIWGVSQASCAVSVADATHMFVGNLTGDLVLGAGASATSTNKGITITSGAVTLNQCGTGTVVASSGAVSCTKLSTYASATDTTPGTIADKGPVGLGAILNDVVNPGGDEKRTLTLKDFVGSGASHAAGGVPDPGASAGSTKFLREDASWGVPPGSGGSSVGWKSAWCDDAATRTGISRSEINCELAEDFNLGILGNTWNYNTVGTFETKDDAGGGLAKFAGVSAVNTSAVVRSKSGVTSANVYGTFYLRVRFKIINLVTTNGATQLFGLRSADDSVATVAGVGYPETKFIAGLWDTALTSAVDVDTAVHELRFWNIQGGSGCLSVDSETPVCGSAAGTNNRALLGYMKVSGVGGVSDGELWIDRILIAAGPGLSLP